MNRKTDVVATYIQLILLIFLHWSLTFMLFIDQCRTRWPVWPVEPTWWRTAWWFCVLQTAPSGGCRCSGRGSTPPSPPSVELLSTGETLHLLPVCTRLHVTRKQIFVLIGWSQVCQTGQMDIMGVCSRFGWSQEFFWWVGCRFTNMWIKHSFCRQQLQMWHNNEQRESCCLLNLNKTPTPWRNVQDWRIKLSTLNDLLLPLQRATGAPRGKTLNDTTQILPSVRQSFISHLPALCFCFQHFPLKSDSHL